MNNEKRIFRAVHSKEQPYLTISRKILECNLSPFTFGLFIYILSKRDTYEYRPSYFYKKYKRTFVDRAIKELIDKGFCVKQRISKTYTKFYFYEVPGLLSHDNRDVTTQQLSDKNMLAHDNQDVAKQQLYINSNKKELLLNNNKANFVGKNTLSQNVVEWCSLNQLEKIVLILENEWGRRIEPGSKDVFTIQAWVDDLKQKIDPNKSNHRNYWLKTYEEFINEQEQARFWQEKEKAIYYAKQHYNPYNNMLR